MSVGGKLSLFDDYVSRLEHVTEGFAHQIAEERMAGFAGALTRAEGAVKNFETAIGRANDAWATKALDIFSSVINSLSKFDQATLLAGTALTTLAGLKSGFEALGHLLPGMPKVPFGMPAGALVGGLIGYEIGERVIRPIADIAGGKYWSAKEPGEAEQLAAHLAKIEADMAKLAEHSKSPEMLETLLAPLRAEAADVRNRLADAERRFGPVSATGAFLSSDRRDLDPSVRGAQDLMRIFGPLSPTDGPSVRDATFGAAGDGLRSFPGDLKAVLDGFSGQLGISLDIKPGPMFEAYVTNIAKSAAERVNASGIGSTGADGSGVDQHN